MDEHDNLRLVEALLFASQEPLPVSVVAERLPEGVDVTALLESLSGHYANRGVHVVKVGSGWALRTAPDLASRLRLVKEEPRRLPHAAMETLAVIAYHQPVTRAEIEEVRGKALSKGTLDLLLEAGWVKPRGRRKTPGRPLTWGTTQSFLDHFGLESEKDLPGMDELRAAGLLDTRPAIAAYAAAADLQGLGLPGDAEAKEALEEDPLEENWEDSLPSEMLEE